MCVRARARARARACVRACVRVSLCVPVPVPVPVGVRTYNMTGGTRHTSDEAAGVVHGTQHTIQHAVSTAGQVRLNSVRRLNTIAVALGPERTRNELLPCASYCRHATTTGSGLSACYLPIGWSTPAARGMLQRSAPRASLDWYSHSVAFALFRFASNLTGPLAHELFVPVFDHLVWRQ